MSSKKKSNPLLKIVLWVVAFLVVFAFSVPIAMPLFNQSSYCDTSDGQDPTSSIGGGKAAGGANGSWTKKGTKPYNNAKELAEIWVSFGVGGQAVAGIGGNAGHESGSSFNPAVTGGNYDYFNADENTRPVAQSANESAGGGKGVFQFTPYTKFAPLGSKKWLSMSAQSKFIMNQIKESGMRLPIGQRRSFDTFKKMSIKDATMAWLEDYEQGSGARFDALPQRLAIANKFYTLFSLKDKKASSTIKSAADGAQESENQGCPTDGDDEGGSGDVSSAKGVKNPILAKAVGWGLTRLNKGITYSMAARWGSSSYDCSGYVLTALEKAGMKNAKSAGNTVGMLQNSNALGQNGKMFKQVSLKTAKKGTIVVTGGLAGAGAGGHTFFLMEDYHGKSTKVLECTAAFNGIANKNTFQYAAINGSPIALEPR
ncbi:hypothetical protein JOC36_001443 [Weissella uvarum]|uniref:phage tail tip lysozyme n=1 Tax=Weissella uvarum TaxID=1479233 RepID=UPI0019605D4B|nr:phage tail tip lysozyme [Weissella uvarum]MBM7617850.1 hypothetical protein [Weissella uvarum]MCM0596152.1 hypothetical protein [Weissella uvarum]